MDLFAAHLLVSVWLGVSILFHFAMGLVTSPGHPPHPTQARAVVLPRIRDVTQAQLVAGAPVCLKCLAPLPPTLHSQLPLQVSV